MKLGSGRQAESLLILYRDGFSYCDSSGQYSSLRYVDIRGVTLATINQVGASRPHVGRWQEVRDRSI